MEPIYRGRIVRKLVKSCHIKNLFDTLTFEECSEQSEKLAKEEEGRISNF